VFFVFSASAGAAKSKIYDRRRCERTKATSFGSTAIQHSLLIEPDSKIVATDLEGEALEKKLDELFPKNFKLNITT
jgi:hypothetical protein